jgi:hypothetical protein
LRDCNKGPSITSVYIISGTAAPADILSFAWLELSGIDLTWMMPVPLFELSRACAAASISAATWNDRQLVLPIPGQAFQVMSVIRFE